MTPPKKDVTLYADENDLVILPGSWRNFSGEARTYNAAGQRNFTISFNQRTAEMLAADGWNVKQRDPREEGDPPLFYLEVKVNFSGRPPKIVMITSRGQTRLTEDLVSELDHSRIIKADIILHPYEWVVNRNSGVSAYLNTLYAEIEENDLEKKYGRYDLASELESPDSIATHDDPPWDK